MISVTTLVKTGDPRRKAKDYQQSVSHIELSENLEADKLEQVANALRGFLVGMENFQEAIFKIR